MQIRINGRHKLMILSEKFTHKAEYMHQEIGPQFLNSNPMARYLICDTAELRNFFNASSEPLRSLLHLLHRFQDALQYTHGAISA